MESMVCDWANLVSMHLHCTWCWWRVNI